MHLLPKISCNYFGTLLAGRHFDNAQPLLFAYLYMIIFIIGYAFIVNFRHNDLIGTPIAAPMLPPSRRFETESRYYLLCCTRDLWGTLVISRYWGGKESRRGNQRHEVVTSTEKAALRFAVIARQRNHHGYREIEQ